MVNAENPSPLELSQVHVDPKFGMMVKLYIVAQFWPPKNRKFSF